MNSPTLPIPQLPAAPAGKPRFSKKVLNFFGFLMSSPSEDELIADGIVPTGRRYDRDLVEAMQRDAMRLRLKSSEVEKLKSPEPFNPSTFQPFNSPKEARP